MAEPLHALLPRGGNVRRLVGRRRLCRGRAGVVRGIGVTEVVIGALSSALAVGAVGAASWFIADAPQTHAARGFVALALSFAAALACAAPLRGWFGARLGGYTGDCLGATQQISEVVFYLCFSAALGMH